MIDVSTILRQYRSPMTNVQMPTQNIVRHMDYPPIQWGGKTLRPNDPAYEIIKNLILKKYGVKR